MRQFVVGDIHGCSKALRTLIETIAPGPDDEFIFLGDYIDRGPDSKNVVDQILALRTQCKVITLRGNHEIMLCGVLFRGLDQQIWKNSGGIATLTSYGGSLRKIPKHHIEFFQKLRSYYQIDDYIFVHANYEADRPLEEQSDSNLYWNHLEYPYPPKHRSGKTVIVGHTPQSSGMILDLGHLICIDTCCFAGGYLTAMNLATRELIQVDRKGFIPRSPIKTLADGIRRLASRIISGFRNESQQQETSIEEEQSAIVN